MEQLILVCTLCDDLFSTFDELRAHKSSSHNIHEDHTTSSHLRSCAFCDAAITLSDSSVANNFLCYKCQTSQPSIVIKKRNIIENFLQSKLRRNELNNESIVQDKKIASKLDGECAEKSNINDITNGHNENNDEFEIISTIDNLDNQGKDQSPIVKCEDKFMRIHHSLDCQTTNNCQDHEVKNAMDKKDSTSDDLNNALINCTVCDKIFKGRALLNVHLRKHSNYVNECRICGKEIFLQFNSKTSKIENSELIHCSKVCPHCKNIENYLNRSGVKYNFADDDVTRYNYKFFKNKGLFPCRDCNRVFKRELSLKGHQYKHAAESICEKCGLPFYGEHECSIVNDSEVIKQEILFDPSNENFTHKYITSKSEFICGICKKKVATKESLSRHMMRVHKKKYSYFCIVCQRHFYTSKVLAHQKFIVDGASKFVPLVKENDATENIMKYDYDIINLSAKKVYNSKVSNSVNGKQCDDKLENDRTKYNKVASLMKDFWENNSIEDSKNMDENHCRICHKTFCSPSNLKRHIKTHARLKKLACDKCGKRFFKRTQFEMHVCFETVDRPVELSDGLKQSEETMCDVCGKVLASVSSLNKHAITHGAKNHICEQCGKGFHHKEYLKEHYIQKHGEGKYKTCPVCNKVLKGRNSYDSHVLRMHPELKNKEAPTFVCSECGKVFNQKGNMLKHQLSHSSNLTFKCTVCNMLFKYPEQLRRHLLWHNAGPKYECHLCDRKFVLNFMLKKHINEYHGGIVLTCKYCDVTIKRYVSMKKHLTRKHSKEMEWQENPWLFIKSLATVSSHYVNVHTSDGPKDEKVRSTAKIKKEILENDAYSDDNKFNDDPSDVDEKNVKDGEDDFVEELYDEDVSSGNDDSGEENVMQRCSKRKGDDSDGDKVKESDEEYHPQKSVSKKRKCGVNSIKNSRVSTKNIKITKQSKSGNCSPKMTQLMTSLDNKVAGQKLTFTTLKKACDKVEALTVGKNKKNNVSKLTNYRQNCFYNSNIITNVSTAASDSNSGRNVPNSIANYSNFNNNSRGKTSNSKKILLINNCESISIPSRENDLITSETMEFMDYANLNYSNVEIVETQFIPGLEIEIDGAGFAVRKS